MSQKLTEQSSCSRTLCMRWRKQWPLNLAFFFFLLSFQLLFSQKVFAYDFEFLHSFLTKKIRFSLNKNGGNLPSPPKSSFLGGQQACESVKLQLLCGFEFGIQARKQGPPSALAEFFRRAILLINHKIFFKQYSMGVMSTGMGVRVLCMDVWGIRMVSLNTLHVYTMLYLT